VEKKDVEQFFAKKLNLASEIYKNLVDIFGENEVISIFPELYHVETKNPGDI